MIYRFPGRFDPGQCVGYVIVYPLNVPDIGRKLSDIVEISELS